MHGFFPGAFLFGPALLFFGLFKILLFVLLIMLIVRLVSHGSRHGHGPYGHAHGGYGHGFGPAGPMGGADADPRRVAALRYAAGKIDRAEFDRIMSGLDAATPSTPPAPPAPPTAPGA